MPVHPSNRLCRGRKWHVKSEMTHQKRAKTAQKRYSNSPFVMFRNTERSIILLTVHDSSCYFFRTHSMRLEEIAMRRVLRVACICQFLLLSALLAYGQGGRGTINRTLTEHGDALIAGAGVAIRNLNTGIVSTATTTTDGQYSAP